MKLSAGVGVSSFVVWSVTSEIVGGVLPVTVRTKLSLAVPPSPSVTVIVMVAVPDCSAAGVIVTVRLDPLPPNAMFATGTSVRFEDAPATVRAAAAVSTSPTVKLCGPLAVFGRSSCR